VDRVAAYAEALSWPFRCGAPDMSRI